ncbi:MAG: DUF362 domain-containing protein [Acidaminococcaceae bacterium]|nr:DUF362 domain-containing protein [Acidaminococcaceae bacterium]
MKTSFKKLLPLILTATMVTACGGATAKQQPAPEKKAETKPAAAAQANTDGSKYIPMDKRSGNKSVVYFTRDLSAKGLQKIYEKVNQDITGKVAIKVHTGEKNGPNIIPRPWVKELIEKDIPGATVVETNTLYHGGRYTTAEHRETLKVNGWTFAPVDILDEEGTVMLPVKGGKYFKEMSMGSHITKYDSLVTLTHFKGHTMGGFGGSNKNLAIGMADGRVGKKMIHSGDTGSTWGVHEEELMERMAESTKATVDHFGKHITFINVLRNMSVDCDCAGTSAAPVVTPDIGILASKDIVAVDQASVDMIYGLHDGKGHDLIQRMESRHGLRQLTYMKELGMGNDLYEIVDLDK